VADEISIRLQNILEFLNRNMNTVEILAVEIKKYSKDNIKTLVSRVLGQSIESSRKKDKDTGSGDRLDEKTFFENLDLNEKSHGGKEFFEELFQIIKTANLTIRWGYTGFSANVLITGDHVPLFEGYSDKFHGGQHIKSKKGEILSKVKNGENIVKKYVTGILKINGNFLETNTGYKYKIDRNLDKTEWESFKVIISNTVKQIVENGPK
jgi:hypothetical protein